MTTRAQRVKTAKAKLAEIEPLYEDAKTELRQAEESFDIGERVLVIKTCKRGCCTEESFEGVVTGFVNGLYIVNDRKVSHYDMKVL